MGQQLSPAMLLQCQAAASSTPRHCHRSSSPSRRRRRPGCSPSHTGSGFAPAGFGLADEGGQPAMKPSRKAAGGSEAQASPEGRVPRRARRKEQLAAWSQLGMSAI
mmetsp:Transcript_47378/g.138101  ORF Transcript_47378/g.138101 Transcript_47378/m.138101 type:complete len:106 (+) Transcript_47378:67-384(+)